MRIAIGVGLAAAGLLLAAAMAPQAGKALAGKDGEDWPITGRTWDDQRFSPLTQIDTDTVGKLGLAWHHEFDTDRGQEATPVEVDGVLYTTSTWSKVYAFDARDGKLLWSYDPQ